ncbi:MAG: hypothetical protein Q9219_000669 [cf. Caloplaca sp. 3 TL-2023]
MYSSLLALIPLLAAGGIAGPLRQLQARAGGGFCNTVFNTDACRHDGWSKVWDTLSSHGVSGFVSFTLKPISTNAHYNLDDGKACPEPNGLEAARLPVVMDPTDVEAAKQLLTTSPAPAYLELFNEPDFSFGGFTPITSPGDSANALRPLFDIDTTTQFLSPAVAYTGSNWLKEFAGNCTECMAKIPIIGAHVYSVDPNGALDQIKTVHEQWPDKRIWVTEIAPSTGDPKCQYDAAGMSDWMTTVVNGIKGLDYVDRIFWNTGTWGILNNNPNACNPSLTNEDGTATDLLNTYAGLCK